MPKTEEVDVLRFFETGSIEKVEAVFNIVCDKMRERLRERGVSLQQPGLGRERTGRRRRTNSESSSSAPEPQP